MKDDFLSAHGFTPQCLYRLFSGSINPRPIAWVATRDAQGRHNLAPFSFFNVASITPPVLSFSPLLDGKGHRKDTLRNLDEVPECVIHISGEGLVEAMNMTSTGLAHGEDEFDLAGLEKAAMPDISVARVEGAPVAFGCRLHDIIRFGDAPLAGNLVLAEVVSVYLEDGIWDGRHVSLQALKPIGRMAGSDYARTTDRFAIERPASGGFPGR